MWVCGAPSCCGSWMQGESWSLSLHLVFIHAQGIEKKKEEKKGGKKGEKKGEKKDGKKGEKKD